MVQVCVLSLKSVAGNSRFRLTEDKEAAFFFEGGFFSCPARGLLPLLTFQRKAFNVIGIKHALPSRRLLRGQLPLPLKLAHPLTGTAQP
jgi:hypothetical protein